MKDLGTVFINKEGHRYCRGSNCEISYSSVSEVIGKYKIPYNAEYWSIYKAYQKVLMNRIQAQIPHLAVSGLEKRSKEMMRNSLFEYTSNPDNKCVINSGENMEALLYAIKKDNIDIAELEAATMDILDLWKDKKDTSITKGNMYHRVREITAINNGYELNAFDHKRYDLHLEKLAEAYVIDENAHRTLQEALVWSLDFSEEKRVITDDPYNDLPDGFYPELMISDDEYLVAGTADRIFFETIFGERFVDIDDYKGFALDTPIATETGWKTIGEIIVGDKIFDGSGNITSVKNVSKIHYNPCYEIKFDTNDELVCDHEHRWVISERAKNGIYTDKEITTDEMFSLYNSNSTIRIKCEAITLPEKDLPIDPYVLGVWLGDGNRCAGTITNVNKDVWLEIESRGYNVSKDISSEDRACNRTVYGLQVELKKLNLLKNKHIPDIYLRSSHNQRLDLLRGLMDADGSFNKIRKRCVMNTTSKEQVHGLVTLASSLGYKPTVIEYKGTGFGKSFDGYAICFSPSDNPFLVRNLDYLEVMTNVRSMNKYRLVTDIKKIETVPTKCLAVESELKTYLVGYSFIKTHNTNIDIPKKSFFVRGQGYKMMQYPVENLMDCKHSYYNLQTSIYAYLLERKGFTVRNVGYHHLNTLNKCEYLRTEAMNVLEDFKECKEKINNKNKI